MSVKRWNTTRIASSSRLIPERKDLKLLINNILKNTKVDPEAQKNDLVVLSDWPETLYEESHHPQNKPLVCFYSINDNYFVSLNWMDPCKKQMQTVLWTQKKDKELGRMIKKTFPMMDQVPPIQAMVHTGSYHMLIAYCGDMCLRLFGDHHQAFRSLSTVPCHFSINCLCYDSETEMLLSGTLGAVVTWFILPNGKGLQVAQTVSMPSHELVQGFSLNGPQGSLLVLCENTVKVFTHQDQGQLEEVKRFTPIASGSSITCAFTCVPQGYLYAGNRAGEIHAWGLDQDNFLHSFQAHSSSVICIHSRPDIHTLLTAGSEGVVREWNLTSGNLLRQLDVDENLQQLQFIDNMTFFCQTTYTFSLYHLPYFYTLFHVCGSAPQRVQRVCCSHNWTRILCATEDGLLRFLSPVTGDLLVITWPLLLMDKAVDWAYDSDREELFVATGSSDVLVFDATRSPCTAKYLVCTSVNSGDSITCLAYGKSSLGKGLQGLMFCGHQSGIVRTLSHYSCARIEKTIHSGAVLALSTLEGPHQNSLLCSYGMDSFVHLTEAMLQGNKVILQPLSKILSSCPLKHVILLPGSVGAITENHCWHLWHYQDILTASASEQSSTFRETKCLHKCAITSFDVCLSLELFVTGGIDGSVRIWNFHGRLIAELNSAFHFGPLCFANNRGDLLLTLNQSLYLVSCLKLLPPALLTHLAILNIADEIQELPKPFVPSFFFSFEIVFVPKFVYLGQGLQELQGLETLVNRRVIAFDNTVPHVVEEESRPPENQELKLHFLEEKDIDLSNLNPEHNRPPHVVPAQLLLSGWDGLNPYHVLQHFFGQGRQWLFAPDGYIPNSVIRARLWPEGTPIFLCCDLRPPCRDKAWDMTEPFRPKAHVPMGLEEEKTSVSEQVDKCKDLERTSYNAFLNMKNRNWMGRKFSEGLMDNLIEAILNLTIYCSVENYKKYLSALAQIFATYQVRPRLRSEAAHRLLDDTTHYNPSIRTLAWEGLDRLGLMNHLFAIPLAMGLMDSDKNVRTKALYLMTRVAGIQTKTTLVHLLQKRETLQEMQQEIIGEDSMTQLLGIQAADIQFLLTNVEELLNENLTLSHKEQPFCFSFDISRADEFEALAKPTLIPKKKSRRRVQVKSKILIKKDLRASRKDREKELGKLNSELVSAEDEGVQREAKKSGKIDTKHVTFSPVQSQDDIEAKEVMPEATEAMEATGQLNMKDNGEVIRKVKRQAHVKGLLKMAVKISLGKADEKMLEKKDLKDISVVATEKPKEEEVSEKEKDIRTTRKKSGRGLAGTSAYTSRSDTKSWRDDICHLVTSRIASSHPGILRDLGKELVDLAQVILADRQPSWDLFQEICPLLKDTSSFSSELDESVLEEPAIITEKVVEEAVKEEETVELREQEHKKVLNKSKKFSQKVKKKQFSLLEGDLVLGKSIVRGEVRKLAKQEGKIPEEERELNKPEKKSRQVKEKLTKHKKNVTHQEGEMPWEGEIPAFPQKKLTKDEQKLALKEKRLTGEKGKLGKGKKMTWKEEKPNLGRKKLAWEKRMLAQKEGMWTKEEGLLVWKDRTLAQAEMELGEEEEELGEEEEKLGEEGEELAEEEEELAEEEEELAEEEEELAEEEEKQTGREEEQTGKEEELAWKEEELAWEEGELAWQEEESAWEEEELILNMEKQLREEKKKFHKKEKYIQEKEKDVEDEEKRAWKRSKLAHKEEQLSKEEKELSEEKRKMVLEKKSMTEQENKLAQEKENWLGKKEKEAHKRKKKIKEEKKQVREEDEQKKQDQKERHAQKEKEAKDNKQRAWERQKMDLEEKEKFGTMEKLSKQKDKQAQKEERKAWIEKRRSQKQKKTTEETKQQTWEKEKMDLEKEEQAREMEEWSLEEEKQVREEKRWGQKEEKLAREVKKEAEEKEQRSRIKVKLGPEEEKKMEETEKGSQKEEKQAMEKEKWAKKKEKWIGKDEKAIEKQKQWPREKEKQTEKERIWGKKEEKWSQKEETKVEQIKQRTWEKEKLSLEEKEQAGEMEKQSQEQEEEAKEEKERALKKRPTQKDSKLAKEERHIAEKEKTTTKEDIAIIKRKEKIPQDEKEIMTQKDTLSQEERELVYDNSSKERDVTKKKKKMTKEERIQALRKLDMEKGIHLEENEASSREKNIWVEESALLKILARTIRETSKEPLEGIEIDGHGWEFFKEQEEIAKEDKELSLEERQLEDDSRMASQRRTLTDEESLEEDRRLVERVQEKALLDKTQVERILKEVQEQNILEKRHLEELLKRIEENEPEKIQVKWLLENTRDTMFEKLYESLIEKGIEEGFTKQGKEEESLTEEGKEGEILSVRKKRKYSIEKWEQNVSQSEEKLGNLAKKGKQKTLAQKREKEKRLTKEKQRLTKKKKEGSSEEQLLCEEVHLSEEEESLSEEEEESLSEEEEESLSEEEESLRDKGEESLRKEEEKSMREEDEEEESLREEEEEKSLREEEEESLREGEGVESLKEQKCLSKEEGEMEKLEKKDEEKEEREKDVNRVLKRELSEEKVSLFKVVMEGKELAEKREGTAKREMLIKRERWLDKKRDLRPMDKAMWPTVLKGPFKIPLQVARGKKEGMDLEVLEDHLGFEGQDSQLLRVHPMTSSWARQEDILLEKARGMFLQVMGTNLETHTPERLHRPESQLSHVIVEPQTPEHRPIGDRWKWVLKYQDSQRRKSEGQAPAPASALASSPEMPTKKYPKPGYSEASLSDEGWINSTLIRLEAGEQLSRDSFRRLNQILGDFSSKRHSKWMHEANLKAVVKHLRQNLELSHTKVSQPYKDVLSPVHLKVIPPIRKREKESWLEPFPIPERVLPPATKRIQAPQVLNWHLLADSYRKKQAQQLSTAVKEIKHLYPMRRDVSTAVCPSVDKKSPALIFQKDIWALRGRGELPKFPKAKTTALPIPAPMLPSATKRIQAPKAANWHLLGEPYRSERAQRLANALKEMEMRPFYPATRDIFTDAHNSVNKQTLALMFQKDFWALKCKSRPPKLPKLEKKAQPISKKREEIPQWETFVALYYVLQRLQEQYGKDSTTWMEQFYQLMDLYQLKSPRIQGLLLELLQRKKPHPQETIYKEALKTKELVLGERLFCCLFCGGSHAPGGPLKFQDVVPLPEKNRVHTLQPVGIAQYGFLELAWKSLPQVNPYLIKTLSNIPTL